MKQEKKGKQTIDTIMREGFPSLHILGNVDCYVVPHMRYILCTIHSILFLLLACFVTYIYVYTFIYLYDMERPTYRV